MLYYKDIRWRELALASYGGWEGAVDMDVGNQIRKYRKGMDYSQADLAEKIYVSSQTISNWENERSYPDLYNLIALSVLFNVSLDELVKGDVDEMRNVIDKSSMSKYSWLMLIFMVLGSLSIGPVQKYLGDWGLVITFGLLLVGVNYAFKVEKLLISQIRGIYTL